MWWFCQELTYMQSLMWEKKSSSNKAGGGDIGIIVGIVQDTMTVIGVIIMAIRAGIEGYLITGEITIETIGGTDDLGIIVPYITVIWIDIGEVTMDGGLLMVGEAQMSVTGEMGVAVLTDAAALVIEGDRNRRY